MDPINMRFTSLYEGQPPNDSPVIQDVQAAIHRVGVQNIQLLFTTLPPIPIPQLIEAPSFTATTFSDSEINFTKKSGTGYDCVGYKIKEGGILYKFEVKPIFFDETGAFNTKLWDEYQKKFYPAIERDLSAMAKSIDEILDLLKKLGYSFQQKKMKLPDFNLLNYNWKKLQKEKPDLPDLDIVDSDGIATDKDFLRLTFSRQGVLSNGKEFVHDQTIHIIKLIIMLWYYRQDFTIAKNDFFSVYESIFCIIEESDCIWKNELLTILSHKIDVTTANYDQLIPIMVKDLKEGIRARNWVAMSTIATIEFANPRFKDYFCRRPEYIDRYGPESDGKNGNNVMDNISKVVESWTQVVDAASKLE